MSRRKKSPPPYTPGYVPAGGVAWCALHKRGMNGKYMRVKHCISRKGACRYLRWQIPEESRETGKQPEGR